MTTKRVIKCVSCEPAKQRLRNEVKRLKESLQRLEKQNTELWHTHHPERMGQ